MKPQGKTLKVVEFIFALGVVFFVGVVLSRTDPPLQYVLLVPYWIATVFIGMWLAHRHQNGGS